MKRILLLCLISMAVLDAAAASNPPQPVQPYTATIWTTTTLHSPSGKAFTFVRRTVYARDAAGNLRREIYRPTKGLQHDTTSPLERVLTSSTSPGDLPQLQSSKETLEQDSDLGTLPFSGVPAAGRRQTYLDANGQRTHTQETWFSPALGLTVHMESRNARGDTVVSDLSELHFGEPAAPSIAAVVAPAASSAVPLLILYRSLFTHIAHLERDRRANGPNLHVNLAEIEDHIRTKIGLSTTQWQALVDTSVRVEQNTRERAKEARAFADQDRAARRDNPLAANTPAAGRATLHKMQQDLNAHIEQEIDGLKATIGPDATGSLMAYLQGTVASSTSAVPMKSVRLQAQKEQSR